MARSTASTRAAEALAALVLLNALAGAEEAWAGLGAPGQAVPLHAFGSACEDPRYPALAGAWVVGCGPDGRVDRALSLATGRELSLPRSFRHPGLGEALVVGAGDEAAVVRLAEDGAHLDEGVRVRGAPTAPPVTDGQRLAMTEEGRVSAWPLSATVRQPRSAEPIGWMPPALAGHWLAWIDDEERLWRMDLDAARPAAEPVPAVDGPQRHVVGSETHLAWVEGEDLVLVDLATESATRIPARTGFSAAPSLWRDVLCWEERPAHGVLEEGDGVDIRCSDGLQAGGPGHQRWPSRWGPYLLYRQDGGLWLRVTPETPASPPEEAAGEPD